jgi:hypothetical protein
MWHSFESYLSCHLRSHRGCYLGCHLDYHLSCHTVIWIVRLVFIWIDIQWCHLGLLSVGVAIWLLLRLSSRLSSRSCHQLSGFLYVGVVMWLLLAIGCHLFFVFWCCHLLVIKVVTWDCCHLVLSPGLPSDVNLWDGTTSMFYLFISNFIHV